MSWREGMISRGANRREQLIGIWFLARLLVLALRGGVAAPAGMLRQERPHLRQFQRSDPAALKGTGLDHAAQFGRWACQSSAPNETISWPKTPLPNAAGLATMSFN